jgi:K+-transporting ATPase ATPase C chain
MASSPSNLGPTNDELLDAVADRVARYREANDLATSEAVPVDAVTASASGLDPHISVANARLQARRVARARGRDVSVVLRMVEEHTERRALGFLGDEAVNVLELNLALDGAE